MLLYVWSAKSNEMRSRWSWIAFRAFLIRRVLRYGLAELLCVCGKFFSRGLGRGLASYFWVWTLRLNPMHLTAGVLRAQSLNARNDPQAREAFQCAERIINNTARVSASDLALMRLPERLVGAITRKRYEAGTQEHRLFEIYHALERHYSQVGTSVGNAPSKEEDDRSRREEIVEQWTRVEVAWRAQDFADALANATPLCARGDFVSPLDALVWAERALAVHAPALSETCVQWAQLWVPERARLWMLRAQLALYKGAPECAKGYLERAQSLNPEDVSILLAHLEIQSGGALSEARSARLRAHAPESLTQDACAQVDCVVENATGSWEIYALPPAGWGLRVEPRILRVGASEHSALTIRACRPDRVRGEPWPLSLVAVSGNEYVISRIRVKVPDSSPGKLMVLVTEDHELWEERGTITRDDVERLLVEKSSFAAARFAPWTHMVEVGSGLDLLDWASEQDGAWRQARERVRAHLATEVQKGNDVQPHLHAFNLPSSADFPYELTAEGIVANKKFLMTAEEHRRDFARAYAPQERIMAVAEAVAKLEELAHSVATNYRALLWRSGQLEFGDTDAERAWSGVALLRAGLLADSDVPKKTFPPQSTPTAFFATLEEPFTPRPSARPDGGEILQLPIAGNLEGDFLNDGGTLCAVAKRTGDALREKPGAHLITLLTHDKFINARRGADEFCLDENYNEWQTIQAHLDAWQEAGAVRVTAQEGIEALLEDGAWRLVVILGEETWLSESRVRYRMRLLGQGIPVSDECPHWVLVTIPPFLRKEVVGIRVSQGGWEVPHEMHSTSDFWVRVCARTPTLYCDLELRQEYERR